MKISVIQCDTVWMDPTANLDKIGIWCNSSHQDTDLWLLPEMFNTGYSLDPSKMSVEWQETTLVALQDYSLNYGGTFGGSIPMFRNGKWYNTFIFVNGDGLVAQYDKIQLFSLAGENEFYSKGRQTVQVEISNWKIRPLVCYDLRFSRLNDGDLVDLIIYSANWPVQRISHWKSLLIARAIENQCFVVGINRVGQDQNGYLYPGNSMIVDFNGEVICEMNDGESISSSVIDKAEMLAFRSKLPFYKDRIV